MDTPTTSDASLSLERWVPFFSTEILRDSFTSIWENFVNFEVYRSYKALKISLQVAEDRENAMEEVNSDEDLQ